MKNPLEIHLDPKEPSPWDHTCPPSPRIAPGDYLGASLVLCILLHLVAFAAAECPSTRFEMFGFCSRRQPRAPTAPQQFQSRLALCEATAGPTTPDPTVPTADPTADEDISELWLRFATTLRRRLRQKRYYAHLGHFLRQCKDR